MINIHCIYITINQISRQKSIFVWLSLGDRLIEREKYLLALHAKFGRTLYTKVFTHISQKATSTFLLATNDFVRPKKVEEAPQNGIVSRTRKPQPYRFIPDNRFSQEPKPKNEPERKHTATSQNTSNHTEEPKFVRPRIELNERQKVEIRKTINANIIPTLAGAGAAIGLIGGGIGAAVGGTVGAALGAIAWFWNR